MKLTNDQIEKHVFRIVKEVGASIKKLKIPSNIEYRRDYDGVSELNWLIEKMVGNILADDKGEYEIFAGLIKIEELKNE